MLRTLLVLSLPTAFGIMLVLATFSSFVLGVAVCPFSVFGAMLTSSDSTRAASMSTNCDGATRFPPLTPANHNLSTAQSVQYEYLVNVTKKVYGDTIVTVDHDGSLQGPFNQLLYTPTIVQAWTNQQLTVAGLLTSMENEAAVLGVLSFNKARYGIYAHTLLAQKAGYTLTQVEYMLAGTCPADITPRQAAVYRLASKLAQMKGPLDSASYNAAFDILGREGVAGVIQQSAAFMYSAVMLNAGDVCLPSDVGC